MNAASNPVVTGLSARWLAWRAAAGQRWRALAVRERRAVIAAALFIGVLLVWLLALQPALRTLREAPAQIATLDLQLQEMRALAAEAATLRGATPISPNQAAAALEAATRQLGAKGRLVVQGDRATLHVDGIDAASLQQWLEAARGAARARPIELQVVRGATGYSGSLVVGLGAGR
ncbi:type II secretion system protein GspM [Piscinibacter sakaiensis]|uniref:type II secretion system protein GspM n=1 Tax=Piscinibacter sakaiensis TaxID=1547922 RepID=UPI003AAD399A